MMAAPTLRAAASLTARTIHIKTYPPSLSLPERREVLKVLQSFGDIDMFRSLKYETGVSNAFLAVYGREDGAQRAVEMSPVRFGVVVEGEEGEGEVKVLGVEPVQEPVQEMAEEEAGQQTTVTVAPIKSTTNDWQDEKSAKQEALPKNLEKIYELRISTSAWDHAKAIQKSPLYGPYTPVSPRRSAIAADLSDRIPSSMSKPGLCDWVTDSVKADNFAQRGRGEEEEERTFGVRPDWGRLGGANRGNVPWRILDRERRRKEKAMEGMMKGIASG